MPELYEGRGFVPGGYGDVRYVSIPRDVVERLLHSWFHWLVDRSRVHLRPAGSPFEAEFQLRRWKTRPDLVLFRWRNSAPTRSVFERVRDRLSVDHPEATVELTPKTRRPRALVLSIAADDVLAPAWSVGLAVSAFRYSGMEAVSSFDLEVQAHAQSSISQEVRLEPLSKAWSTGKQIGAALRRTIRPFS